MKLDHRARERNRDVPPQSKPLYLREWRTALGMTQAEVAERMGVHFTLINKWEKDIRPVESHAIDRLGQVFGIPTVALFFKPENAGDAKLMTRVFRVLNHMPRERIDPWLAFAESTLPPEAAAAA